MFEEVIKNEKSLSENVADKIIKLIIDRNLAVGEKLPNEFDIAQNLGVGRGTVREAIKQLVSRNIVEIRRGKGTFVSHKPGVVEDPLGLVFFSDKKKLYTDLFELRFIMEPKIAKLAAKNATDKDIIEMKKICKDIKTYTDSTGKYDLNLDLKLHIYIAKSTGNTIMPKLIPIIQGGVEIFKDIDFDKRSKELISLHSEIVNAIADHDEDLAESLMKRHLENGIISLNKVMENSDF